ncbi:MAG: FAD-dependent oxidoreductase [Latescibacteria bacterium DG_63]|nr:MAG: FAD-dependent oxidoreductase [Latescibacteria bacterium DG_63]
MKYDVIIVGAGPAGIFAALELTKNTDLKVVMCEKGKDLKERNCSVNAGSSCRRCTPCEMICGWGGAGAFSDGKLNLSPEIGGSVIKWVPELPLLIDEVDSIFLHYGAPEVIYGEDEDEIERWQHAALKANLKLIPGRMRHLGTERCRTLLGKMRRELEGKLEIRTQYEIDEIATEGDKTVGVVGSYGEFIEARYVICAPGRSGADWLQKEARRLNLTTQNNPVDVGVRVEIPGICMESLTNTLYEPKLIYYSRRFDDRIRLFCMNPYGEVVTEYSNRIVTVNGHSWKRKRTLNTNFALLVSTSFTHPFREPIRYGEYLASLANMLGDGVLVQRLGDLQTGRRSTPERIRRGTVKPTLKDATPGDISFVLPYRYLSGILEMIEALNELTPGVNSPHTLLYAVEVKFYSMQLALNHGLETEIQNLFAIGDGAGITRGLVQAAASGLWVGRNLRDKL